ncbi:hypothetical protein ACSQ6I_25025 [Anabaena sp. WFMT]
MSVPHLYRQLQAQVSQWIHPQDMRNGIFDFHTSNSATPNF